MASTDSSTLYDACSQGDSERVSAIITDMENSEFGGSFLSCLAVACVGGHVKVARLLLENAKEGVNVYRVKNSIDDTLHAACWHGHPETFASLIAEFGTPCGDPYESRDILVRVLRDEDPNRPDSLFSILFGELTEDNRRSAGLQNNMLFVLVPEMTQCGKNGIRGCLPKTAK